MDLWNRPRALVATVLAAYQHILAEPQELSTRRPTKEEIEERETQAALRELERAAESS